MSFPRYERYKDSGVEWLGEVPEHWQLVPFWTRYRRTKRLGYPEEQLLSAYRDHGVVPKASRDDNNNKASDDLNAYQLVEPGDLVINKMKAWQGSVAVSSHQGIVSPAYFVYSPHHADNPRYLHYLMRSDRYITGYLSLSKGVRIGQWDLDPVYHSRIPLSMPPIDEQDRIATFIDDETTKIDALIEEQRQLIEMLKEKRQAVISHAVTKGLNPLVPMKDSGTFWIGEVPKHWSVSLLRYFARFSSGSTPDRTRESYWGGDIPWVKTGEIDYAVIDDTEEMITTEGMAESSVTLVPAGSMLLALYGQGVTRGRVAMLGVAATFNQACVAIESDKRMDRAYLFCFFVFAYRFIREIGNETTQMNLNLDFVKAIRVPLPPLPEQRSIAEAVASHIASSDSLVGEAMNAIELLQERRSALISAAVTGKIDVRNYTPKEAA